MGLLFDRQPKPIRDKITRELDVNVSDPTVEEEEDEIEDELAELDMDIFDIDFE